MTYLSRLNSCLYFIVLFIFASPSLYAAEQALEIIGLNSTAIMNKAALLAQEPIDIKMDYNRAYPGQLRSYRSVPLCRLLQGQNISAKSVLEFVALDSFSVFIPAHLVTRCNKGESIAYLAIEPEEKWPVLFNHTGTTAGPFSVIWTDPQLSYISDEYWAWSVVKIIEHKSINRSDVIAAPSHFVSQKQRTHVLRGYQVYVSHCASCHTINHQGKADIGPDLNRPKNPLDYYPDIRVLKQFIRDPQSVRKRDKGRMSGSSTVGLNDDDLNDLIEYFRYTRDA